MAGFSEGLDVFGGDAAPSRPPLQMTIHPQPTQSRAEPNFSGAFGVFSGEDVPRSEPAKKPPMSVGRAGLTGLKTGLTANFSDELSGAANASPLAHSPT